MADEGWRPRRRKRGVGRLPFYGRFHHSATVAGKSGSVNSETPGYCLPCVAALPTTPSPYGPIPFG